MNLLEEYKHKNKDPAWRDMFSSLAKNKQGRVFNHINTNFRTQNAFVTQFTEFEKVEGVSRCDWETQSVGGQEFDKHRVFD